MSQTMSVEEQSSSLPASQDKEQPLLTTETNLEDAAGLPVIDKICKNLAGRVFSRIGEKRASYVGPYNQSKRARAQDGTKTDLTAVNKLVRYLSQDCGGLDHERSDGPTDKCNMILVGSAVYGEASLVEKVATYFNIPFAHFECSNALKKGYIVERIEDALAALYESASESKTRAEKGILFIDNIDELRISDDNPEKRQVQEGLLKVLEGSKVRMPFINSLDGMIDREQLDTTNILFIAAGAFDGLEDIVHQRQDAVGPIQGKIPPPRTEKKVNNAWLNQIDTCDLIKYSLLPQFVARFQIVAPIQPIQKTKLYRLVSLRRKLLTASNRERWDKYGIEQAPNPDAIKELVNIAFDLTPEPLETVIDGIPSYIKCRCPIEK